MKLQSILFLGILLLAISGCNSNNEIKNSKPNIILILVDDLGWKDAGFMGSTYYETPNIDNLAKKGMVFTNAYANAPNCAPSRASLLTGQYTPRHGIYTVNSSERGDTKHRRIIPTKNTTTLSTDKITIAELLKEAGYVSASIGKWHMGNPPELGPKSQGFDVNIAGNHAGHPKSYFSPYKNKNLSDGKDGEHLTERLTNEALTFIETNKEQPFFLYLPYYAVHTPLQGKEEKIEKYKNKQKTPSHNNPTYAAMIESVDNGVGKITAKLDELKLSENTVVIFFSDNGGFGGATAMDPLRGSKGMLYEGGIRIPMIVRWEGTINPKTICDTMVIGSDIFPTLTEIAGVEIPENQIVDGKSIVPLLLRKKGFKRDALFWHFPAYLQGNYKGSRDKYFRTRPCGVVRMGDWKLIEYFEDNELELYNLKSDIGETRNLANDLPKKRDELHKVMKEWRASINAPVPTKRNPEYNSEN
ncbi:MAG: sulfatase [Bacteroidota bacterium]